MEHILSQIIAKAWSNPEFKENLIKEPRVTLQKEGIDLPEGVKVTVYENTDQEFYLVIPCKPSGELSEEEMSLLAGGQGYAWRHVMDVDRGAYGIEPVYEVTFTGAWSKEDKRKIFDAGPPV